MVGWVLFFKLDSCKLVEAFVRCLRAKPKNADSVVDGKFVDEEIVWLALG